MTAASSRPKALILVVHYRTEQAVLSFLETLSRLPRFDEVQTTIIDNGSGEEYLSRIRGMVARSSNLLLIHSPVNKGYLGAARFALDQYPAEKRAFLDWIIVANSDIVIEDRAFLEKLFAMDPGSVGIIAPKIIVTSSNLDQNPHMRRRPGWTGRLRMRIHSHDYFLCVAWDWLFRAKQALKSRIARVRSGALTASETARVPIYAPHGSFMIFSRKYFEAGGYLDDRLFLYGEEISAGEICRRLGLPVIYDPSLLVFHNEHQSLGTGITRTKFHYHRQSVRHVLSEYLLTKSTPARARQEAR